MLGDYIKILDTYHAVHLYQPIYQLETGRIFGYEALLRSVSLSFGNPLEIFNDARGKGALTEVDFASVAMAIDSMVRFDKDKKYVLFANIFPSTLLDNRFLFLWDRYIKVDVSHVVLELSEAEPIADWKSLRLMIDELRDRGIRIAIDDLGRGYSFLQHWVELEPEFIKIDRYFVTDLATNVKRQEVLGCLKSLFKNTTEIIAEGIEKVEDLEAVKMLGIRYGQGYLLGKPCFLGNVEFKSIQGEEK